MGKVADTIIFVSVTTARDKDVAEAKENLNLI